ncbi:beta-ketoacyl-ACP synthase III [Actinocrinis sp.]|uniref:beta-ketoacyl-ACP synthase III n=1 Tax=Actinocrinis sp. TaxID=1920516 RepID=UPI002D69FE01|nr:beta-ketoacyl-ACP synthase III [Actinocrinis sp.]HZP51749.1 beta-ketoacyl-ACP synthase III [Actinocrinis sp.]
MDTAVRAGSPGSAILGVGGYRPARIVGNDEICRRIDSSDEWIRKRSGIAARRIAGPDETVLSMAAGAAAKAMAHAGLSPELLDTVLLASVSRLEQCPPGAPRVASALGARGAAAMDVGAACAGFCYSLAMGDALIRSGSSRYVAVIGSEKMSDIVDPEDRGTAFLFGDGAGAVVLGPAERPGVGPVVWGSDGDGHHLIQHNHTWLDLRDQPDLPWPTLRMEGTEVFRWAMQVAPKASRQALEAAGVGEDEISAFIPHQANGRIIDAVVKAMGLPDNVLVAREVTEFGNTSAASVPLALEDLVNRGGLPGGSKALMVGFGAGLVYAAQVVELP